jgi:flagellar basal-body rod modification protein FlgD
MSTVSAISSVTGATSSSAPTTQVGAQAGQTQLNQFLTLLTTQLKNQDPTQPTDPTQFVTQLAEFSTVEQLTQSNTTLSSISSSVSGLTLGQYSNLINHSVTAPITSVTVPASGSVSSPLTFNITNAALTNPHIAVTNASGAQAASFPVNGTTGTMTFDGTDGNGNALPAGQYSIALVGAAVGAAPGVSSPAGTLTATGTVSSVAQGASGVWNLNLQDGQVVSATAVTSVD